MKDLSYLSDAFPWMPFKWDIRRNDEMSGTGDGRVWQASLAPELWTATISHRPMPNSLAEEMDAKIRALRGANDPFLMASSLFCNPKADPAGTLIAGANVTVTAVNADTRQISLGGLPANYRITAGDKLQIVYQQGGSTRYAFLEAVATKSAGAGGTLANLEVFPNVPAGVAAGAVVTLSRPAVKCVIVPGTHTVGQVNGRLTSGGSFQVIQKK